MIAGGLYVVKDPFVPLGRPERRAMKRWILWGSFFGRSRPAPREQIVRVGNTLRMRPETFERLRSELRNGPRGRKVAPTEGGAGPDGGEPRAPAPPHEGGEA